MQERIDHHHSALTSFHRKRQIAGWMFAIPAVIFLCVFVFYPVLYNVWLSFTNAKRLSSDNLQFAGLKNYIKLFTDKTFAKRFWTEIVWTVTSVIGQIVVGLLFALVISNKHLKGGTVLRTFLLVPYVVPAIVIALVTRWMLSGDYGIISVWLQNMGVLPHRQTLLALPKPALAVVIIVNIWRSYPFPMLIYWAALKGIDAVMYEAARVDGANSWQIFWRITLPQLKGATALETETLRLVSSGSKSQTVLPSAPRPMRSMAPVIYSRLSARAVLPFPLWPSRQTLRMFCTE